jgi:hypothetical protein
MSARGTYSPTIQRTALPGEDNYGFVDRFTAAHAAFGVLAGLGRLPAWATLTTGLVFDLIIERHFKNVMPNIWPNPTQDTWMNIAGDTLAMMAGWKFATMLPKGSHPNHTTIQAPQEPPTPILADVALTKRNGVR